MSTRCITIILDEYGEELLVLYRQHDGDPEGHGAELAEFLRGRRIVDGLPRRENDSTLICVIQGRPFEDEPRIAVGMECLAGQIVAHFKEEVGEFYVYPSGRRGLCESYIYVVTGRVGEEVSLAICEPTRNVDAPVDDRLSLKGEKRLVRVLVEGKPSAVLTWIKESCTGE